MWIRTDRDTLVNLHHCGIIEVDNDGYEHHLVTHSPTGPVILCRDIDPDKADLCIRHIHDKMISSGQSLSGVVINPINWDNFKRKP